MKTRLTWNRFSRRWVVQEIALARRAVIYCGKDKISWNKFAIAVELFVEVETATHRLSEVMKTDPKYFHVPGWFEYVSALGASLVVDATGRLFRDYKGGGRSDNSPPEDASDIDSNSDSEGSLNSDSDDSPTVARSVVSNHHFTRSETRKKNRGQPLLRLEYLVSSMSIFDTSVEHDTIYALLAIAKDTTPIAAGSDAQQSSDHAQLALEGYTQRKRYPRRLQEAVRGRVQRFHRVLHRPVPADRQQPSPRRHLSTVGHGRKGSCRATARSRKGSETPAEA